MLELNFRLKFVKRLTVCVVDIVPHAPLTLYHDTLMLTHRGAAKHATRSECNADVECT